MVSFGRRNVDQDRRSIEETVKAPEIFLSLSGSGCVGIVMDRIVVPHGYKMKP